MALNQHQEIQNTEKASLALILLGISLLTFGVLLYEILKNITLGKEHQVDKVIQKIKIILLGYEEVNQVKVVEVVGVVEKIKPAIIENALKHSSHSPLETVFDKIESTLLISIDKSWDFAVDRTAATLNYGLMPVKWGRVNIARSIEYGLRPLSYLQAKFIKTQKTH